MIIEFRGPWYALSNFAPIPITLWSSKEGGWTEYPTSEHAFNALKTMDASQREWVRAASTPGEAKRRGRQVTLRPGWDERYRLLVETHEECLREGNHWHDNFWGDCQCEKRPSCAQEGKNWLGKLLMRRRTLLGLAYC